MRVEIIESHDFGGWDIVSLDNGVTVKNFYTEEEAKEYAKDNNFKVEG
jgi:hypothetical protein